MFYKIYIVTNVMVLLGMLTRINHAEIVYARNVEDLAGKQRKISHARK